MGRQWPIVGLETLNAAVPAWGLLNEVAIIFITSNHSLASGQITEGTQPCPSTELKILLIFNLWLNLIFNLRF